MEIKNSLHWNGLFVLQILLNSGKSCSAFFIPTLDLLQQYYLTYYF